MDMDRFNKRLTMMNKILTELNLQHLAEPFRTQKVGLEDVELLTDDYFYNLGVLRIKDKCRLKRRCHEELRRLFRRLNTVELSHRLRAERSYPFILAKIIIEKRLTMMNKILTELNLQHLAKPFRTQKVGLEDVELLTDDDFYNLGVLRIKDKCRLKRRCHEVLTGKTRLDIEDGKTIYWELRRLFWRLCTEGLSHRLRAESITFEDVIYLSENDLETLGVEEESERGRFVLEFDRLLSEIDYAEIQEQDDDSDQFFGENADTKFAGKDLQMSIDLDDNAKFEQGARNNYVKSKLRRLFRRLCTEGLSHRLRAESITFEDVIYLSENDLETLGVEEESERGRFVLEFDRLLSEIDYAEIQEQDDDSDQFFGENADTKFAGKDLQMSIDLDDNAKFEQGARNNYVKRNQSIIANTIGRIVDYMVPQKNQSNSTGEKMSLKMGEDSVYKSVYEYNKNERNETYTADRIGAIYQVGQHQHLQMSTQFCENAKFETRERNNYVKRNRNIGAKTIDRIGNDIKPRKNYCSSTGGKISFKMGENSTIKTTRENNRLEMSKTYTADHIGAINGNQVSGKDIQLSVEVGDNVTIEKRDRNNDIKFDQSITATTIENIGNDMEPQKNQYSSTGGKTSFKIGDNTTIKTTRENIKIERKENYTADHIGANGNQGSEENGSFLQGVLTVFSKAALIGAGVLAALVIGVGVRGVRGETADAPMYSALEKSSEENGSRRSRLQQSATTTKI